MTAYSDYGPVRRSDSRIATISADDRQRGGCPKSDLCSCGRAGIFETIEKDVIPDAHSGREGTMLTHPKYEFSGFSLLNRMQWLRAGASIATLMVGLVASSSLALAQATGAEGDASVAASSQSDQIETVTVTANKRAENQQNVPISVTAVSGATLAARGVSDITNLGAVTPGLAVQQNDGFMNTHMRGIGSSLIGPGLENPVGLYVDGVYYGSQTSSLLDFVDVANVQILKGPQGTLFGRNTTGGAILITTKTPTQDFHLDAGLTYGNYNTGKGDLYVSGGVADNLAADFAIQVGGQGDGYGKNHANGKDVYKTDSNVTARSKWVYTPTAQTKITAIFDYSQVRGPINTLALQPGTFASPVSATYSYRSPWDTNTNTQPLVATKGGGASLRVDHDFGFATLTNLVAYRRSSTRLDFDLDFTPLQEESAFLTDHERQFSEELDLQSEPGSRIKWTVGVYYYNAAGKYMPGSVVDLAPPLSIGLVGSEKTQSLAGYGQATMEVLPSTNLTVGARYSYERRQLNANQHLQAAGTPILLLDSAQRAKNFYRPTFRVALDHRFSSEMMAYVSFNTGFKSGGFNTQVPTDPAFAPEFIKAYEIGMKNDLFDHRLRGNIAGFYYDYTNIQEQHLELTSSGIINGPKARIYGLDVDLEGQVTARLKLGASLEYLHARFTGSTPFLPIGVPSGLVPLTTGSVKGNYLPVSPDVALNLTADYVFPLFGGDADANATYQYNSGWYAEPDNVIHQGAYNWLNLSLQWFSSDGRYSANLWCKNATDVAVLQNGTTQVTGVHNVTYKEPRTFGLTVGYHL